MSDKFDEFRNAVKDAEYALDAAKAVTRQMGSMVASRLRECDEHDLARMKRALRDFNIHTGCWKR